MRNFFCKVIGIFALLIVYSIIGNVGILSASTPIKLISNADEGSLMNAFSKLSRLNSFTKINPQEYKQLFPEKLGDSQGLIAPDSQSRVDIIKILKEIPDTYFYSESRTQDDKFLRCYIEQVSSGKYQMMYVTVGTGDNDVVIALFSGAQVKTYEEFGDFLIKASFEDVKESVVKTNAECPIVLGSGMEMTSMSINDKYWTIEIKINTNGYGLSGFNKDQGKTLIKGVDKYQISQIYNLNIGYKMVFTSETGESKVLIFEHKDLAEVLNDTDITTDDVLQTYIENNKKACPLEMEKGMFLTDVSYSGDILCHEISVDEKLYSIDLLNSNSASIKRNMEELISSGKDQTMTVIAEWLIKANKGLGYTYLGKDSKKTASIVFSCEELKKLLSR